MVLGKERCIFGDLTNSGIERQNILNRRQINEEYSISLYGSGNLTGTKIEYYIYQYDVLSERVEKAYSDEIKLIIDQIDIVLAQQNGFAEESETKRNSFNRFNNAHRIRNKTINRKRRRSQD